MRDDRVLPVQDSMRPPGERPDEDLRVGAAPDPVAAEVRGDRQSEIQKGKGEIDAERDSTFGLQSGQVQPLKVRSADGRVGFAGPS